MKRRTRAIISIVVILFGVVCFLAWSLYFRERLTYKEVVTLKSPVMYGEVLTSDKLQAVSIDQNAVIEGAITRETFSELLGKTSMYYLPANSQLIKQYFEDELVLQEGEVVFQIPPEWVYNVPQSLRRNDTVKIYIVHQDDLIYNPTTPTPAPTATPYMPVVTAVIVNEDGTPYTGNTMPTIAPQPTVSPTPTIAPKEEVLQYFFNENAEMIFECKVMYVKDTTNREIITLTSSTGHDRLDGTAKNYSIEIIATDEMINQMKDAVAAGYKFILVYE